MIVLTGAGGFIGSVMLGYLNKLGRKDVVIFDDMPQQEQYQNIGNKKYISIHSTQEIITDPAGIECVIHLGANSNTIERDWESIYKTNVYSTRLWNQFCTENEIPFIFASSAAVYGNNGVPLNLYAFSKLASEQEVNGVILRLFNVYGPNEYHKGRMASTIFHWYNQIDSTGQLNIFKDSKFYRRDFIWVEDVCKTILHFVNNYQPGIYDLGTGINRDFETVANVLCATMKKGNKNFIEMPPDLKEQYQTDTKANVENLKVAGVDTGSFLGIEQGIPEYIEYLKIRSRY